MTYWDSAASLVFEVGFYFNLQFAAENKSSSQISQLALTYLHKIAKLYLMNEETFKVFGLISFAIASKVIPIKTEQLDSNTEAPIHYNKQTAEMEQFVLKSILQWKLCYTTPYELIQALIHKLRHNNTHFHKVSDLISIKATQISELLLICKLYSKEIAYSTLDNHSVLSIAIASLYGAIKILDMKDWVPCLEEYINDGIRVRYCVIVE